MQLELKRLLNYFYPKSILDIGANLGQFRRLAKTYFQDSEIFSIEANPLCEPTLKENFPNEYKICLLGAENYCNKKFFILKTDPTCTGNSVYRENSHHYVDENVAEVYYNQYTLDSLNLPAYDLIKLDTQGSELDIIKGGLVTCSKAKGLLIEVQYEVNNIGAPLQEQVESFLATINFKPVDVLNETNYSWIRQRDVLYINQSL